jgi:hypothetical protein
VRQTNRHGHRLKETRTRALKAERRGGKKERDSARHELEHSKQSEGGKKERETQRDTNSSTQKAERRGGKKAKKRESARHELEHSKAARERGFRESRLRSRLN